MQPNEEDKDTQENPVVFAPWAPLSKDFADAEVQTSQQDQPAEFMQPDQMLPAPEEPIVQPAEEEKSSSLFDIHMLPVAQPAEEEQSSFTQIMEPAQLQPIVQPAEEEEKEVANSPKFSLSDERIAQLKSDYKSHFSTPLRQGWRTHSFIRKALQFDDNLLNSKSESEVHLFLIQLMLMYLLDEVDFADFYSEVHSQ